MSTGNIHNQSNFIAIQWISLLSAISIARNENNGSPKINPVTYPSEKLNIAVEHAFVIGPFMNNNGAHKIPLVNDPNSNTRSIVQFNLRTHIDELGAISVNPLFVDCKKLNTKCKEFSLSDSL